LQPVQLARVAFGVCGDDALLERASFGLARLGVHVASLSVARKCSASAILISALTER